MCLKNIDKIVLKNGQTLDSAVNELTTENMAKMLGEHYLRECIHAQINEGNISVASEKGEDDRLWIDYPSPKSLADIEKRFDSAGSLAVEILGCTEPECGGKCCTTYRDMDEFEEYCGDDFLDYGSDDFGRMHLIPNC